MPKPDDSSPAAEPGRGNRLLQRLPRAAYRRIQPHLRTFPLTRRLIVQRPNEPIRDVIFPEGGIVSVTRAMTDGRMVEVATVGREGLVGIDAVFGAALSNSESLVQVPGSTGARLPVALFRAEVERPGPFREAVMRYGEGLMALTMQSAACLALHPVQQRCCRWLLMAHDRVERDRFSLSQEFLATMLGSARPTVSTIAGALQRRGAITYVHGTITILDRARLERGACECYAVVREHFARLGL